MPYLISLYCLVTAINAVLPLLHYHLLLAFYIAAASLLCVAVGDDVKTTLTRTSVMQKLIRTLMAVVMLFVALWLARHFAISLYFIAVRGLVWCVIGVIVGFLGNPRRVNARFQRLTPK